MNRIITILVTIFILLLLYIWISHVWGSDKPKHPRQIVDATEGETLGADDTSGDIDTSLMAVTDDTGADESAIEQAGDAEGNTSMTGSAEDNKIEAQTPKREDIKEDKPAVPEKKAESAKPKSMPSNPPVVKTSQPVSKPTMVTASADGKHLVIVGNFLQLANANQRMQELKKAGFNDVEVVNFDLSEYHTVCAGRFDDINEARRLVKKLKDYHKIDAYVRIGS